MKRASTPTHTFVLEGLIIDDIKIARISYAQGGRQVLQKSGEDITFTGNDKVSTTLTQEETNLFKRGPAYTQLRIITKGGKSLHTDMQEIEIERVIDDEVLPV